MNKIIRLNVGGVKYSTTMTTLTKYGGFPSLLMKRESDEGAMDILRDSKGRIFIDRDGKIFKYILEFLRSDTVDVPEDLIGKLLIEADYYQIKELQDVLLAKISGKKILETVTLNVGDEIFTVSYDILRRATGDGFLFKIYQCLTSNAPIYMHYDAEGNIFIDRSPKGFKHLLAELRGERPDLPKDSRVEVFYKDYIFYLGYGSEAIGKLELAKENRRRYGCMGV
jgi:hypothetical protein